MCLDPAIHRALRVKAVETARSVSDIVDEAVHRELAEDEEDWRAFEERAGEKTVSCEKVLADLKAYGER